MVQVLPFTKLNLGPISGEPSALQLGLQRRANVISQLVNMQLNQNSNFRCRDIKLVPCNQTCAFTQNKSYIWATLFYCKSWAAVFSYQMFAATRKLTFYDLSTYSTNNLGRKCRSNCLFDGKPCHQFTLFSINVTPEKPAHVATVKCAAQTSNQLFKGKIVVQAFGCTCHCPFP